DAGSNDRAHLRAFQQQPNRERGDDAGAGYRKPIGRKNKGPEPLGTLEKFRARQRAWQSAPDPHGQVRDHQQHTERKQYLGKLVMVYALQQRAVDRSTENADRERRDQQGQPEISGGTDYGQSDIATQQIKRPMRQ